MKATFLCLAHALIIAMARVNGDPKYKSNRDGYSLDKPVEDLMNASGVDLRNGGGLDDLSFRTTFRTIKFWFVMV